MTATDMTQGTRSRPPQPEMVPRFMVIAMFSLMGLALSLTGYAQLTDAPNSGVLIEAPIEAERTILMVGARDGNVTVLDEEGSVIALSSGEKMGFVGVVWRVLARHRYVEGVPDTSPVRLIRRVNGNIAIHDTATDWSIELIGYGVDNVAAFAKLVD